MGSTPTAATPRKVCSSRVCFHACSGPMPEALLDETGENFDPHRIRETVMQNEKPGGHGERAVAVAVLDMAVYDLIAKIEGKPLHRLIADRYTTEPPEPDVFVYAAGGYYYPNGNLTTLQDEMRRYLDLGYRVVKMKIGGATLSDDLARIEAVIEVVDGEGGRVAVDANGRFDRQRGLSSTQKRSSRTVSSGTRSREIRWTLN